LLHVCQYKKMVFPKISEFWLLTILSVSDFGVSLQTAPPLN